MIKGVLFDMGGTLVENIDIKLENIGDCLYKYVNHNVFSKEYFDEYFEKRVIELLKNRGEKEYQFSSLVKGLASKFYILKDLENLEKECCDNLCKYCLVDNVIEYLDYLKMKGMKMIVLSNTCFSKDVIVNQLDQFGLIKYFSDVVVSSEYDFRKPNEKFFKVGLESIGLKADEVVMIGNSLWADVEGASRLGIKSILIDKDSYYNSDELKKVNTLIKTIKNYNELFKYDFLEEIFLEKYISKNALACVKLLKDNGYEAYIVGGAVRNAIIGLPINDYDLSTNALPSEVENIFRKNDYKVVLTGEKHGTVTAIKNRIPYEITTFRSDGEYLDNRHPESVKFGVRLEDDLSRRDFTINAMCYDGKRLIDLFGGIIDLKNGLIRTVGESKKRFEEDGLRILRALRFASLLGFDIEEETRRGILEKYDLLSNIAIERINDEVIKLLIHPCKRIVSDYSVVFEKVYNYRMDKNYIDRLDDSRLDEAMRFAIIGPKVELCWHEMKLSNNFASLVMTYQKLIYEKIDFDTSLFNFRKFIFNYGKSQFDKIILFLSCIFIWNCDKMTYVRELFEASIDYPYSLDELDISGNDLMDLGIVGKDIKKAKELILDAIYKDELVNKKEEILKYIKKIK